MEDNKNLGEKVVNELQKDFTMVGKRRIHSWHAWLTAGIILGVLAGIAYVANQSGQFDQSLAGACPIITSPAKYQAAGSAQTAVTYEAYLAYDAWRNGASAPQWQIERYINPIMGVRDKALGACSADLQAKREGAVKYCTDQKADCKPVEYCTYSLTLPPNEDTCVVGSQGNLTYTYIGGQIQFRAKSDEESVACSCSGNIPGPTTPSGGGTTTAPVTPAGGGAPSTPSGKPSPTPGGTNTGTFAPGDELFSEFPQEDQP